MISQESDFKRLLNLFDLKRFRKPFKLQLSQQAYSLNTLFKKLDVPMVREHCLEFQITFSNKLIN